MKITTTKADEGTNVGVINYAGERFTQVLGDM